MKRPPNQLPQALEKSKDLLEILGEIMGKLDLLTERIEGIEQELNMQETYRQTRMTSASSTLTEDELETTISVPHRITIVNHATPRRGGQMPVHVGCPATSAPSTPQVHPSPRGRYQLSEEPFPLTPQTIPTRHIPTFQQAKSRLDETKTAGPPFFVVFKGQEPGVFTDWPFVLRTCKWKKGDWKKYETRSAALQAYEDAYIHGGLKLSDGL